MNAFSIIAVAASLLLAPAPSSAQGTGGLSPEDVRQINAVSESFSKAVIGKDWKAAAALYTVDGVLYPPDEAAVRGRTAIEICLAVLPPLADLKLRSTKVEGRDDLAYVQGTYTMTIAGDGTAPPAQESGYYLEIRRRQPDGRWLIAVHMLHPH
ncbi:MAG TPA: DUF4440 domain-containing protein [Vicinamibacterales bacterium]|nr:DUF4440 domain-containing protein [Vicinamibacterales bacterium]